MFIIQNAQKCQHYLQNTKKTFNVSSELVALCKFY